MQHTRAKRKRDSSRGFTIIETCIALLVLMVVGLGVSSLFLYAIKQNSGAGSRALVLAVGQQQLEELRGATYANLESTVTVNGGASKTVTMAGQQFTVATSFTYTPSTATSATATMKTVTIDVSTATTGPLAWVSVPVRFVMARSTQSVGSYSK